MPVTISGTGTITGTTSVAGTSGPYNAATTITATDASWSVPTLADPYVKVTVIGGGGGGGNPQANTAGTNGGNTTFGVGAAYEVIASGGLGGGPANAAGRNGTAGLASGNEATGSEGFVSPVTRGAFPGTGGQIKVAYIDLTGVSTISITIGAGGAGGAGTYAGGNGGRGEVIFEYRAG